MNVLEQEKRLNIFIKSGWICEECKGYLNRYGTAQLGHRIPNTKPMIKRYGKRVIHHKLNLAPTCSLKCNAKVAIGKSMTEQINSLVNEITRAIDI